METIFQQRHLERCQIRIILGSDASDNLSWNQNVDAVTKKAKTTASPSLEETCQAVQEPQKTLLRIPCQADSGVILCILGFGPAYAEQTSRGSAMKGRPFCCWRLSI